MLGALAGIGGAATLPVRADAQQKVAQANVQYQKQPKDGQMCNSCVNFQPPAACKVVDGTIDPNGWCLLYARRS